MIWIYLDWVHRECPVLQHPRFWKLGTDAVVLSRRHLHRLKSWLLLTWSRGHHGQQRRRNFRTRPQLWGRKPMETTNNMSSKKCLDVSWCLVAALFPDLFPDFCAILFLVIVGCACLSDKSMFMVPSSILRKLSDTSECQNGPGFSAVRASAASFWSWPRLDTVGDGATMCKESNRCSTATSATVSFKWHSRLPDFWKLQVDWSVRCSDRKARS